jgi:hypothetical protein
LEALKPLSFGRLSRFQFAGMNMTTLLDGGLGTVKWIQNIKPCRPQSLQYYIQQLTKKAENRRE